MTQRSAMLYLLADGARARFVEREGGARSFITIDEIDARDRLRTLRKRLRAAPQARTHQSASAGLRHALAGNDTVRRAKSDFVLAVAERATTLLRAGDYQKVVVAAPDRLLAPLRERLESAGAGTIPISRDLTKTPDCGLADWLEGASPA